MSTVIVEAPPPLKIPAGRVTSEGLSVTFTQVMGAIANRLAWRLLGCRLLLFQPSEASADIPRKVSVLNPVRELKPRSSEFTGAPQQKALGAMVVRLFLFSCTVPRFVLPSRK